MGTSPKVLVTGANGHIGSHIVRAVLAEGWTPVGLIRAGCDRRSLTGLDLELRTGDLLDVESVDRAMRGIEVLFHAAGVHRNFVADPAMMERPVVDGTHNVLVAARRNGVRRVVCTSSAVTVGFTRDPQHPLDESHYLDHPRSVSIRSKVLAER
jgi:dihydroflavonol-4-reductase